MLARFGINANDGEMETAGISSRAAGDDFAIRRPVRPARKAKKLVSLSRGQLALIRTIRVGYHQLIFTCGCVVVADKSEATPVRRKPNWATDVGENLSGRPSEGSHLIKHACGIVFILSLVVNVGSIGRERFPANVDLSRRHNLHVAVRGHLSNPQTSLPAVSQDIHDGLSVGRNSSVLSFAVYGEPGDLHV